MNAFDVNVLLLLLMMMLSLVFVEDFDVNELVTVVSVVAADSIVDFLVAVEDVRRLLSKYEMGFGSL